MSEVSRINAELEALDSQRQQLVQKLADARAIEQAAEIDDIRKRIVAFNISVEQLFPDVKLPAKRVRVRAYKKSDKPAMYQWGTQTWHGKGGPKPKWFTDAIAAGITVEQMKATARAHAGPMAGDGAGS